MAVLRLPLPARRTFSVTASPAGTLLRSAVAVTPKSPTGPLKSGRPGIARTFSVIGFVSRSRTRGRSIANGSPNGSMAARTPIRIFAAGIVTVPGVRPDTAFFRRVKRATERPSQVSRRPCGLSGRSRSSAQSPGNWGASTYSIPCTSAWVTSS